MKVTNNNLQETMDEERPKKQGKAAEDMNWDDYQSVATIYDWIESLRLEFPDWITIEEIGYSYEGRPIKVVKLSKNPAQVSDQISLSIIAVISNGSWFYYRTIE